MEQLSVHDYYDLGRKIDYIEREVTKANGPLPASALLWPLFLLRWKMEGILTEPCALLPASQRAARSVIGAISSLIPEDVEDVFKVDKSTQFEPWQFRPISQAIKSFETVFSNDMPEMSTFAVAQIGIYRTEDLIKRSSLQIDETIRPLLQPLALQDIHEAGKCLAFRVPTAAAFHLSRAIETGMNQYYEALTGKPFELKDAAKNWGIKTEVLTKAGAEEKITEFLVHIRKAYRNPVTHPDVIMEPAEAFNFFPQAISVISMMLLAVKAKREKDQPSLPGLEGIHAIPSGSEVLTLPEPR